MWQTLTEILFAKIRSEKRPSTLLFTIVKLPKEVLISAIHNSKHLCGIKLSIVCFPQRWLYGIVQNGQTTYLYQKHWQVFSFAPEEEASACREKPDSPLLPSLCSYWTPMESFIQWSIKCKLKVARVKEWKIRLRVSNPLFHFFLLINKNYVWSY